MLSLGGPTYKNKNKKLFKYQKFNSLDISNVRYSDPSVQQKETLVDSQNYGLKELQLDRRKEREPRSKNTIRSNKTGLQPASRACGTTPFGFKNSRRKNKRDKQTGRNGGALAPLGPNLKK